MLKLVNTIYSRCTEEHIISIIVEVCKCTDFCKMLRSKTVLDSVLELHVK